MTLFKLTVESICQVTDEGELLIEAEDAAEALLRFQDLDIDEVTQAIGDSHRADVSFLDREDWTIKSIEEVPDDQD